MCYVRYLQAKFCFFIPRAFEMWTCTKTKHRSYFQNLNASKKWTSSQIYRIYTFFTCSCKVTGRFTCELLCFGTAEKNSFNLQTHQDLWTLESCDTEMASNTPGNFIKSQRTMQNHNPETEFRYLIFKKIFFTF